jgi:hypothetical protein
MWRNVAERPAPSTRSQGGVDPPGSGVHHALPDVDGGYQGHDIGHVKQGCEESFGLEATVIQQRGHYDGLHDAYRHGNGGKAQRDHCRLAYHGILEETDIVVQPNPLRFFRVEKFEIGERKNQRGHHRQKYPEEEANNPGGEKDKTPPCFAAGQLAYLRSSELQLFQGKF